MTRVITKILRISLYIVVGALLLFLGIMHVTYSRWFQNWVKAELITHINSTQNINIELDGLSIDFPLKVELNGLVVVEPDNDTLISAKSLNASVKLLPLLVGDVAVNDIRLINGYYRLGSSDSAMYMRIRASKLDINRADVSIAENEINLAKAIIDGGNVNLVLKNDSAKSVADSAKSVSWEIKAEDLLMRNFNYLMTMTPTIDTLETYFNNAHIADIDINLNTQMVHASMINGRLEASYLYKNSSVEYVSEDKDNSMVDSAPWTIIVDSINFTKSKAKYAKSGIQPSSGMDFEYIIVDSLDLAISSFYNRATEIKIPITHIEAYERSGLYIKGTGEFAMDSVAIMFNGVNLSTAHSNIKIDGMLGTDNGVANDYLFPLMLHGNGQIGIKDVAIIYPQYQSVLNGIPTHDKLDFLVDIDGSMNNLKINSFRADLGGRASVSVNGAITDVSNVKKMHGSLSLEGEIVDADFVNAYISDDIAENVKLPKLSVDGNINVFNKNIAGEINAMTHDGDLAMSATWQDYTTGYDVAVKMEEFPIEAFLPRFGIGRITGDVMVEGKLFDPFKSEMEAKAVVNINKIEYLGKEYEAIDAKLIKQNRNIEIAMSSQNADADFAFDADCILSDSLLHWMVNANVEYLNLNALELMEQKASVSTTFDSKGVVDIRDFSLRGELQVDNFNWHSDSLNLKIADINAKTIASETAINVSLQNNDMIAIMSTTDKIDSILMKLSSATDVVIAQLKNRKIDVTQIQKALPRFNINVRAGSNNMLSEYLANNDQSFRRMILSASNDSMIIVSAKMYEYKLGTTTIDTIAINANQYDKILMYDAMIGNRKGTLDKFAHVDVIGYIADDLISTHIKQRNISGIEGYNIGAVAHVGDSLVRMELFPEVPIIGYKGWSINDDNFIEYNMLTHHIDADVEMKSEESLISIYTEHNDSASNHQEDVIVKIKDVKLSEWLAFNPYAPPIKGDMSADMNINWGGGRLNGKGKISLDDFVYGKESVGTFVADIGVSTDKSGQTSANATLMVDDVKTVTIAGTLNDSTAQSPFMLDFSMIHFPLKVLNPMLPKKMASLKGTLNGKMTIGGNASAPVLNGKLDFDSASVYVGMAGSLLSLSENEIIVEDNVVRINDFDIMGVNKNPLVINGTVNINDLSSPQLDLTLKARDMQIFGNEKSKKADIYGKGYIDVDAKLKGSLSFMDVNASINLLGGSNITYIMPETTSALSSYSTGSLVKFVEFSDTATVNKAEDLAQSMMMNLDVALVISEGSTINIDLSSDGKNRVQLQGSGTLNYEENVMGDSRFIGRYTIEKGFVRYTPPLMSEKLFDFEEGSYVAFNGDMFNPILNISAVDDIKATVTQDGQDSRLVNFDVRLSVTNTLSNMNVAFDLSSPNDIAIANELSSMSAEQRANQAMNLLLYNVYTGSGTKANSNMVGNPLYAFVESKLNTWAANNIGFVDISFGIDQYDKTSDGSTTTTTNYSYKVSKTLFNDRFKIVVGGNYSTDAETDENYSQNLINDISFEYMLNRSGSMYIKLFRQVGYESILEGEVTQTGVGFVYKRKLKTLKDVFNR